MTGHYTEILKQKARFSKLKKNYNLKKSKLVIKNSNNFAIRVFAKVL